MTRRTPSLGDALREQLQEEGVIPRYDTDPAVTAEDKSIRIRIGRALNLHLRTAHAITFVSLSGLATCVGILRASPTQLPALVAADWKKGVDTHVTESQAELERLRSEQQATAATVTNLVTSVDRLWCTQVDQWRWEAVRLGQTERARYLSQRLREMSMSGKDCR